jgi:hypothetical protein
VLPALQESWNATYAMPDTKIQPLPGGVVRVSAVHHASAPFFCHVAANVKPSVAGQNPLFAKVICNVSGSPMPGQQPTCLPVIGDDGADLQQLHLRYPGPKNPGRSRQNRFQLRPILQSGRSGFISM